ncbi:alpha/beta hydrolase [Arthrospiribacter ruber]|uniref:Esterase family protein n=1 Tax=Arthrospiribacter ruber TaxID=2487934 RepID=A0A951MB49_9BACT|nr:alpha/beta hydrolase-fold protein [Arthrospiribacter ruber]MBW3467004.1 esterase family protein [Arthrospiribacter ruber]
MLKLKIPLMLFLVFIAINSYSQTGIVYDNQTIESEILNKSKKYSVYLPPGYNTSERDYPILYLLHGANDDHTGWIQYGKLEHTANEGISNGTVSPMIIVMPHAETDKGGYFNSIDNTWRYEDFFFDEFIPHVEEKFRVKKGKRFRAIAGLSMGGGGTLMYALRHPDLFQTACPLSSYIGPLTFEDAKAGYSSQNAGVSDGQMRTYYRKHNALSMVEDLPEKNRSAVRWYLDCGDDDFLYEGNSLLHIAMKKNEIPHQFRVRDGDHTWKYWQEALPDVLEFVSKGYIYRE